MKLTRRQFLAALFSVGATIALPVAFADATPSQINTAWKQLLKEPWYFDVNEYGTIIDASIGKPTIRSDIFDVYIGSTRTPQSLVYDIESCYPLTRHFQQLAADELEEILYSLEDDASLSAAKRKHFVRMSEALDDEQDGWSNWILLAGATDLSRFRVEIENWLAGPIEWSDYEWFPRYSTAQGSAMVFFESLPNDTLDALNVVIVEGDCPGSTYFAAELHQAIDEANATAELLELPFRFREEGSGTAKAEA